MSSPKTKESRSSEVWPISMEGLKIPETSTLRETQGYKDTFKLLQWQRDNYFVGHYYAERRNVERQSATSQSNDTQKTVEQGAAVVEVVPLGQRHLPFDPASLGHQQLVKLAAWFIPTPTVQQALVPIVVDLPSGPLKEPITHGVVDLISGQQHNLDDVVKEQLTRFFTCAQSRELVKESASNYISRRTPPRPSSH